MKDLGASGTLAAFAARVAPDAVRAAVADRLLRSEGDTPSGAWRDQNFVWWLIAWSGGAQNRAALELCCLIAPDARWQSYVRNKAFTELVHAWPDAPNAREVVLTCCRESASGWYTTGIGSWWQFAATRPVCWKLLDDRAVWVGPSGARDRAILAAHGWVHDPAVRPIVAEYMNGPNPPNPTKITAWSERWGEVVSTLTKQVPDHELQTLVARHLTRLVDAGAFDRLDNFPSDFQPNNFTCYDAAFFERIAGWEFALDVWGELIGRYATTDRRIPRFVASLCARWRNDAGAQRIVLRYWHHQTTENARATRAEDRREDGAVSQKVSGLESHERHLAGKPAPKPPASIDPAADLRGEVAQRILSDPAMRLVRALKLGESEWTDTVRDWVCELLDGRDERLTATNAALIVARGAANLSAPWLDRLFIFPPWNAGNVLYAIAILCRAAHVGEVAVRLLRAITDPVWESCFAKQMTAVRTEIVSRMCSRCGPAVLERLVATIFEFLAAPGAERNWGNACESIGRRLDNLEVGPGRTDERQGRHAE